MERELGQELEKEFNDDAETFLSVIKPENNHLSIVKGTTNQASTSDKNTSSTPTSGSANFRPNSTT